MSKVVDRITTALETAILSRVKSSSLYNEYYNRSEKRAEWKKQATIYDKKEIKDWKLGILTATDPDNPRRGPLMRFYQSLMLDAHLGSCIDNRILPIQCAPFKLVDANGVADTEAHKLLERPWYIDLVKLVCNQTYEGTKLIELIELNEKGELREVTEIPQSNFIAQKGIIIKEEWDTQGVSYKDGIYKDYYIQVGADNSLGLLNQLAMIVLAKKLGLGSWMSYIEKFGIPPIFVTTDRMDTGRLDQLFDMLMSYKSNHFGILQGGEKVETPNNGSVDGYQSFKSLKEVCDQDISKRLLGGTGTSDSKSFVGSAEVHERLLKYRHQVDKLIFKFYFNEEIKPRLIKLSSVYAPLDKLYFEFDESETLTLKEILEAIEKLSDYYDFDVEELVKITGLPILSIKAAIGGSTTPPAIDPQKKKPSATVTEPLLYGLNAALNINARTWDDATEQIANKIYEGTLKPSELNNDLVLKYYSTLTKGAATSFGNEYYSNPTARQMRDNLMKFAGAKAYNLMSKIEDLKSFKTTKAEFIDAAKKLVNVHNETYMNVERDFASAKASAARDYQQYVKDIDIYPNLKLNTMEDDQVRESHEVLNGIIKPVSEWKVIPPFEPKCRCFLTQSNAPATTNNPPLKFNEQYANNPAINGEAFTDKHSYFQISKKDKVVVHDNTERMKNFTPYDNSIELSNNKKVYTNDFADPTDLNSNIEAAKKIAILLEKDIYILPHLNTSERIKNPELGIGKPSKLGDLKTYDKVKSTDVKSYIKNNIFSANKQKCEYVILDLTDAIEKDFKENTIGKLRGDLSDKSQMNSKIKNVVIIRGNKSALITRQQINSKDYAKIFNELF